MREAGRKAFPEETCEESWEGPGGVLVGVPPLGRLGETWEGAVGAECRSEG